MSIKLDIDLGIEEVEIGGTIVKLVLNDNNLPVRFEEAENNIQKYIETIQKENGIETPKNLDEIGEVSTGDIEKDIKIIKSADEYIKSQVDYIFNCDGLSKSVLGNVSALTVNAKTGEYLYETILNAFVPIINEKFNASLKSVKSRIKKYTDYKGIHPALKKW